MWKKVAGKWHNNGKSVNLSIWIYGVFSLLFVPRKGSELMHDFNCMDADNMDYELMAERTRYLKENPKVSKRSKILEGLRNKALKRKQERSGGRMLPDFLFMWQENSQYAVRITLSTRVSQAALTCILFGLMICGTKWVSCRLGYFI